MTPGGHRRKVNGILGLLCREYFPGLVTLRGTEEPAWTWEHYVTAPDQFDRGYQTHRTFNNMAERVKAELWVSLLALHGSIHPFIAHFCINDWIYRVYMQDFFTCEDGYEEEADRVAHNRCYKLVKDMHYEAQVQCVINYGASFLRQKIKKEEARNLKLTKEQYLEVTLDLFSD